MIYALIVVLQVAHPAYKCQTTDDFKHWRWDTCPGMTTLEVQRPSKSYATKAECLAAQDHLNLPAPAETMCAEVQQPEGRNGE